MSDIAIRAEGLSKLYRLGKRERYRTLRDTLTDTLTAPFRRGRSPESSNGHGGSFWALKDLSFEVKHGEVVGLIGRNGAGKSTLLKVLSRITEPTEGEISIRGRIASLLEVGTGFHPELSGRDNVYLNGAILGMKKSEIQRKFDEIVAFAEVDKFIDTPVKHYSSGMYVRLAFAVAAHLEPEILVIDEVLAVGDAAFQEKCLGKMDDVARHGRTVIFVSHNMGAVSRLCPRGMLLDSGRLVSTGDISDIIDGYSNSILNASVSGSVTSFPHRRGSGTVHVAEMRMVGVGDQTRSMFLHGENVTCQLRLECSSSSSVGTYGCELFVRTITGTPVLHLLNPLKIRPAGMVAAIVRCTLTDCKLYPGTYVISAWIGSPHEECDVLTDVLTFRIEAGALSQELPNPNWRNGLFLHPATWDLSPENIRCQPA
jgi:lipopolysaccharide transport system ATP-binding protein